MEMWKIAIYIAIFILYLLINLFDLAIISKYMKYLYGSPQKNIWYYIVIVLIIIAASGPYATFTALWGISLLSLFLLKFYPANKQNKILFGVVLMSISFSSLFCSFMIAEIFMPDKNSIGGAVIFFPHIIFVGFIEIVCRIKISSSFKLPIKIWILLLAIPLMSLFGICTLSYLAETSSMGRKELSTIELLLLFIFLFMNLIVFYLFAKISDLIKTGIEKALLKHQVRLQEQYYQDIKETQKRVRSIRHDMKNHLETISYMIQDNQTSSIKNYLKQIMSDVQFTEKTIFTGNSSIDLILNIKTDQAKKSNIQINTNILIPQNLNIDFLTAVILLGNIFDNAIEACLKLPEERRKIDFKMNYIDSILYLELRNSFEKVQINQNNELITSKSDDPFLHGIGMQNVKAIVNKYNGIIKINTDNNRFSVKMVLYDIKTNYGN